MSNKVNAAEYEAIMPKVREIYPIGEGGVTGYALEFVNNSDETNFAIAFL